MKALFIGGTGQISQSCVEQALRRGIEVSVFNRGSTPDALPAGVTRIHGTLNDAAYNALGRNGYDVVCQFFAFRPDQIEKDIAIFGGNTGQYIFISSASAYHKPVRRIPITEDVPLINPHWQYSRDKAACEAALTAQTHLPFTIVRPSHTVRTRLPMAIGDSGTCIARIRAGKPLIVHGDGTSFWTVTRSQDFAVPFTGLFGKPAALGQAFHITSDLAFTFDDIHETVGRLLGHPVRNLHVSSQALIRYNPEWEGPLLGDKAHCVVFDNSRVKQVAGDFTCAGTLEEVLAEPLHHVRDLPADPALDALFDRIVADAERLPPYA
jgi:nucleoside-diphosphate-sugar epimerase